MDLPRGMRDLGPADLAGIEAVRGAFVRTARLFSFELMDPSPIESLSTLEARSGPAIRDEIYHFRDKGGRDVALRFDFTVGLARHVASERSLRMPAKLGSFGGVFRYDEPQRGRYRYFHQWNVEIFGRPCAEQEAEVIEFAARLFEELGLRVEVRISHRAVVESFVGRACAGLGPEGRARALADSLRMVDKAAKRGREELLAEYRGLPPGLAEGLLELASARGTPDEAAAAAGGEPPGAWAALRELWASLQNRGVANAAVDLGIVRGLDYYSGAVFEVFEAGTGSAALAGGGRYDALTGAFGRGDVGAAGIAGGVERAVLAMGARGAPPPAAGRVSVLYANGQVMASAVRLASQLRARGVPVDIDLAGRPLRRQMEAASGSRRAVIVAPAEEAAGQVVVRDMEARTEARVGAGDLLASPGAYL